MSEDSRIRDALAILEGPTTPSEEFADSLFEQIVAELDLEPPQMVEEAPKAPDPPRKIRRWLSPRTAIAFGLAVLLAVVGVIVVAPNPPSALAVIQEARSDFSKLPPYHAKTRMEANDDSSSPDFEMIVETEDWYASTSKWRTQFISSMRAGNEPESFRVSDGTNVGDYDASTNIFRLSPLAELDDPLLHSPSFFFDPSFQWWGTGSRSEAPKPSDQFFAENCEASETEFIGRVATKLVCDAEPSDIEVWVDEETGMLLKVRHFDIQREIRSIEFNPEFDPSIFETKAPVGALLRWEGKGAAPAGYEAKIGESVTATYPGGFHAGNFSVGSKHLWFASMTTEDGPFTSQIHRMDPRNGKILATIPMRDRVQVSRMVEAAGYLWVLQNLHPDGDRAAALQRLDLNTNKLIEPVIDLGRDPSGLVFTDGALWATAGKPLKFKVGRAEGDFIPISRIDPKTFEVTSYDIQLVPTGNLVAEGGALFTAGFRPAPSGESSEYVVVLFDIAQKAVTGETKIDAFPNAPVAGFGSIWLTAPDAKGNSSVVRIDPATMKTAVIPSGKGSGSIAIGAGAVWVSNFDEDVILKIDPQTNQIVSKVTLGPAPGASVVGFGSLWVSFGTGMSRQVARILLE